MSNRIPVVLSAAALPISLVFSVVPAQADATRPSEAAICATPSEFRQIHQNDTRQQVQEILDGPGRHSSVSTDRRILQREWKLCGTRLDHGRLIVRYSRAADRVRAWSWITVHGATLDS